MEDYYTILIQKSILEITTSPLDELSFKIAILACGKVHLDDKKCGVQKKTIANMDFEKKSKTSHSICVVCFPPVQKLVNG